MLETKYLNTWVYFFTWQKYIGNTMKTIVIISMRNYRLCGAASLRILPLFYLQMLFWVWMWRPICWLLLWGEPFAAVGRGAWAKRQGKEKHRFPLLWSNCHQVLWIQWAQTNMRSGAVCKYFCLWCDPQALPLLQNLSDFNCLQELCESDCYIASDLRKSHSFLGQG